MQRCILSSKIPVEFEVHTVAGKIVFVLQLTDESRARIEAAAPGWEIVHGKDSSLWLSHLKTAEIIGGWSRKVEAQCLGTEATPLRWIHNWGAGVDRMPLQEFRRRDIILTNASGVHAFPISETVWAMLLAWTRKLHTYIRNQSRHTWSHNDLSLELHGSRLGILGVGAIGAEIARLGKAFGMQTYGLRRSGQPAPWIDAMYGREGLNELLAQCDYVVNALPLTDDTRQLMGKEQFSCMRENSFYVNIGRGGTTDEAALIAALEDGRIAGAGLDVFETEPLPADNPLWRMDNVIVTPHSSGTTGRYDERVIDIFVENLSAYLDGKEPGVNRVDLDRQY